ncbi:primosomal protein DnaI [Domibacillus epiphyticus]|uniref:Primosomal protein DnaI n=1 Tax=Domibacillus epiphyticus TaxID=1714355 RepID=A0A1V2A974_9BACI|nr:primosomal protein DnaI [Domibacillus epiphyticus]OMP67480.1 primosomal protein DnaI [Domibacillus epiphyticus]
MKKINEALGNLKTSPGFSDLYEKSRQEVMSDKAIRSFIEENNLSDKAISKGIVKLDEYRSQSHSCSKCPSLDGCINIMKGYEPELVVSRGAVEIEYKRCPQKLREDEMKHLQRHVKSFYMPKDVLKATFPAVEIDNRSRLEAVKSARDFVDGFTPGEMSKGLYIHGKFGVGKSFLFGAIANELAEKHIASMIVYFPEFVREMKQSLNDQTTGAKVEAVKSAPVLMIDDIGAETMSSWIRDDILGTILQHRMLEGLPVLFTSNFDYYGLEHHLTYSQRGESEALKAARIMERIKYLTVPVEMTGVNRRK